MKRLGLLLIGAATAFVLTSPAQAEPDFRVIRWDITGICQVYDFGWGAKPTPSDYRRLTPPLPTLSAAIQAKQFLRSRGQCLL
jgi:hypothetical protein